jgi:hypothetical protein
LIPQLPVKECCLNEPNYAKQGDEQVASWEEIGIQGFRQGKQAHPIGNTKTEKRQAFHFDILS